MLSCVLTCSDKQALNKLNQVPTNRTHLRGTPRLNQRHGSNPIRCQAPLTARRSIFVFYSTRQVILSNHAHNIAHDAVRYKSKSQQPPKSRNKGDHGQTNLTRLCIKYNFTLPTEHAIVLNIASPQKHADIDTTQDPLKESTRPLKSLLTTTLAVSPPHAPAFHRTCLPTAPNFHQPLHVPIHSGAWLTYSMSSFDRINVVGPRSAASSSSSSPLWPSVSMLNTYAMRPGWNTSATRDSGGSKRALYTARPMLALK